MAGLFTEEPLSQRLPHGVEHGRDSIAEPSGKSDAGCRGVSAAAKLLRDFAYVEGGAAAKADFGFLRPEFQE